MGVGAESIVDEVLHFHTENSVLSLVCKPSGSVPIQLSAELDFRKPSGTLCQSDVEGG